MTLRTRPGSTTNATKPCHSIMNRGVLHLPHPGRRLTQLSFWATHYVFPAMSRFHLCRKLQTFDWPNSKLMSKVLTSSFQNAKARRVKVNKKNLAGILVKKSRQHPDFPGGHPPEYYPSLRLLNFTERTGYGVLSLRWPSTLLPIVQLDIMLALHFAHKRTWIAKYGFHTNTHTHAHL